MSPEGLQECDHRGTEQGHTFPVKKGAWEPGERGRRKLELQSAQGKDLDSEVPGQEAGLAKVERGGGGLGSSSDDGITTGVGGWCLPESFAQPRGTIPCQKGRAQPRLMDPKPILGSTHTWWIQLSRVKGPGIHISKTSLVDPDGTCKVQHVGTLGLEN